MYCTVEYLVFCSNVYALKCYFYQITKDIVQRNPKLHYNCRHYIKGINEMYERDKNDKIMCPIIMFRRASMEKKYNIGNKLD